MTGKFRLVLLSFLMLFVELALIRWVGSNVIYLSYFSNFVLLGSFLGIGLGFLRAKSRGDLFPWAIVALAFLVGLVLIFPTSIDRSGTQLIFFGGGIKGLPIWVMLPVIFIAVAAVMALIAQGVARAFAQFEPLEAYRLDIFGSLAGIVAFSLLSFLGAPPVAWGTVVTIVFIALYLPGVRMIQVTAAIVVLLMLGVESLYPGFSWSPYYKIDLQFIKPGLMSLDANGIPHQWIESMAWRRKLEPLYFVPYARLRSNPLRDVLIVGAGGGSDVAIALAAGAKHVDAVEIDPRIYQLGRKLNPDRPYQDARVSIHINDGRAFLQRTTKHYDLILFALPDSLTLVSGQSSLRLESYLFTLEALRAARAHLNPGGAFGMYNYYRQQWLVDRYASTLQAVFGRRPCVDSVGGVGRFALLMVALDSSGVVCRTTWDPGGRIIPAPASDDYPFPYLQNRSVPSLYLIALALMLIASLALIRGVAGPLGEMRSYLDLFFMGAAFLLLETKNVVQFALLFGTTWFVNALVFFGILLAVLGAIEVARRVRFRDPTLLYAALFASLAVAWAIEPQTLLSLDLPLRFAAAVLLAFAPVFLANLVFAERFRDVGSSTVAFATNLLGAMFGGVLEYSSLILGYRSLLVVVALVYGLAFFFGRKSLVPDVVPAATTGSIGAGRTTSRSGRLAAMDVHKSQTLAGLDLRKNSIGFLRFFFAASVIWSHAFGLTGFYDPVGRLSHHALSAGLMAVGGFFVLSGFLITRSYESASGFGRFLWHRVLRIFPGFWVCLAVVAFVFAPIAFVREHGSLSGFFAAHPGPVSYVVTNALLTIRQGGIDGLLAGLPYPFAFNGSLWTLAFEFACYLAVGALGVTLVLRRGRGVVGVAALWLFLAYALLVWEYGARGTPVMLDTFSLFVYFGFGAAAYLFRDQIPMRASIAAVCAVAMVAALPTRAGAIVAPVCFAYLTMYAAQKLPIRNFDRRMDLSYGLYIYAFPIQQLLILYGVNRLGLVPYVAAALFIALAFAAASWFAIERPCLSLKNAAIPAVRVGAPWRRPTSRAL